MSDQAENTPIRDLTSDGVLKLYQAGPTTVLGFGGVDVPSDFNTAEYRDAIANVLAEHHCKAVAFDLTGVTLIPSGMLGFWASLREDDISVELYNASDDIREVLELTKLNQWIKLSELDL